jgi:CTP:phosphocholine cytidylyltransferase-like protein
MKTKVLDKPYFFKKFRTYTVERILAAGGTTAFGKLTGYDPKKLYQIKGESLTDEEFEQAIKMLTK